LNTNRTSWKIPTVPVGKYQLDQLENTNWGSWKRFARDIPRQLPQLENTNCTSWKTPTGPVGKYQLDQLEAYPLKPPADPFMNPSLAYLCVPLVFGRSPKFLGLTISV
jgi:hypothetical protein